MRRSEINDFSDGKNNLNLSSAIRARNLYASKNAFIRFSE